MQNFPTLFPGFLPWLSGDYFINFFLIFPFNLVLFSIAVSLISQDSIRLLKRDWPEGRGKKGLLETYHHGRTTEEMIYSLVIPTIIMIGIFLGNTVVFGLNSMYALLPAVAQALQIGPIIKVVFYFRTPITTEANEEEKARDRKFSTQYLIVALLGISYGLWLLLLTSPIWYETVLLPLFPFLWSKEVFFSNLTSVFYFSSYFVILALVFIGGPIIIAILIVRYYRQSRSIPIDPEYEDT